MSKHFILFFSLIPLTVPTRMSLRPRLMECPRPTPLKFIPLTLLLSSKTFTSHFILHFLQMTAPLDTYKSLLTLLLWITLTFLHPSQDFIFLSASKKHPLGTHIPQEET